MFKRFSAEASVSGRAPVKTSVNRAIRKQLQQNYPSLGDELELLLPKKKPVFIIKAADHTQLVECRGLALFFSLRDEEVYIPTLTTVHKYPDMMPQVQVDYGAIPYVMHGAQIMCRGLTSKGGKLPDGLKKGQLVIVMAEGKERALAVGRLTMSSEEIRAKNEGIGVENIHFLGDGLWQYLIAQLKRAAEQEPEESDEEQ